MKTLSVSADRMMFLEGGQPWVMRGLKSFPLLGRLMNEGELVAAGVVKNARGLGANTIEALGMVDWWPNLKPANPKFWPSLTSLAHITEQEGMRLLLTVFADAQLIMPDEPSQIAHWNRVLTHLGGYNHILYMVSNQGDKNGVPESTRVKFVKAFPGQLCCRDNPMQDANPTMPPMDWSGYCSTRDDIKGFVEVGSSMFYVVHGWGAGQSWQGCQQVAVLTEPMGAAEVYSGGRRWADPGKFRQLARSLCFRGTGGALFHSQAGTASALIDETKPIQRACAIEFLGNLPRP